MALPVEPMNGVNNFLFVSDWIEFKREFDRAEGGILAVCAGFLHNAGNKKIAKKIVGD